MKERLTGAIILVALIVLLVPELLTGPVHSAPRSAAVASSVEESPLRSYTIKLADEPRSRGTPAHSGPDQPAPLTSAPAPAASPAPAAPAADTTAAAEATSAPMPPAVTTTATHGSSAAGATAPAGSAENSGAYVVQLGSFASRANADRLARKVRAQGFPVSVSQGSSGRLYRVRVGPAHDRVAAGDLAQQLRAHGHSGAIVPQ